MRCGEDDSCGGGGVVPGPLAGVDWSGVEWSSVCDQTPAGQHHDLTTNFSDDRLSVSSPAAYTNTGAPQPQ